MTIILAIIELKLESIKKNKPFSSKFLSFNLTSNSYFPTTKLLRARLPITHDIN